MQRVVCGTKFDGNQENYYGLVMEKAGVSDSEENRIKLRGIYDSELESAIIFPETREVLNILQKQKFKLGLVSNAFPPTKEKVLEMNSLEKYFDMIFVRPGQISKA